MTLTLIFKNYNNRYMCVGVGKSVPSNIASDASFLVDCYCCRNEKHRIPNVNNIYINSIVYPVLIVEQSSHLLIRIRGIIKYKIMCSGFELFLKRKKK